MDLTLVPFGYLESERRLVDVHQVSSGKQCGCLCPSCRAPLIARKGSKKVWHFAHDSKSETRSDLEKCSYSFFVSARMMARQLIGDRLSITLPKYEIVLSEGNTEVREMVTESRHIQLKEVVLDTKLCGKSVDLLGRVNGYSLAIVFSHPGRELLPCNDEHNERKTGLVEIALDSVRDRFRENGTANYSYSDILVEFIKHDVASKKWIYHPRYAKTEKLAKSKLKDKLETDSSLDTTVLGNIRESNTFNARYRFVCRQCDSSWIGADDHQSDCQKCGSFLLVSRSKITDEET